MYDIIQAIEILFYIRLQWLGDILRIKEANDSWIEEGFIMQKSDMVRLSLNDFLFLNVYYVSKLNGTHSRQSYLTLPI